MPGSNLPPNRVMHLSSVSVDPQWASMSLTKTLSSSLQAFSVKVPLWFQRCRIQSELHCELLFWCSQLHWKSSSESGNPADILDWYYYRLRELGGTR